MRATAAASALAARALLASAVDVAVSGDGDGDKDESLGGPSPHRTAPPFFIAVFRGASRSAFFDLTAQSTSTRGGPAPAFALCFISARSALLPSSDSEVF